MDEASGGLPLANAVRHPHARASLDEALADEQGALCELLVARERADGEQVELLDLLIARKRHIIAALRVMRARLDEQGSTEPATHHSVSTVEDTHDG
ncbi:MAG: hypothetical protein HY691_05655 [Chloroflexi bacterium]|nr:hypothetical protein [Chloroflexota bacterium]